MLKQKKKLGLFALALAIIMISGLVTVNVFALNIVPNQIETPENLSSISEMMTDFIPSQIPIEFSGAEMLLTSGKAEFRKTQDINGVKYDSYRIILTDYDEGDNEKGTYSASNLGSITFKKVGKFNNRDIDVKITMDKVTLTSVGEPVQTFPEGGAQVAVFFDGKEFWIGGYQLNKPLNITDEQWGNIWSGQQHMDITTDIVYSDNGEPVKLPFIHLIKDLDNFEQEGVATIKGYSGNYYYFKRPGRDELVAGNKYGYPIGTPYLIGNKIDGYNWQQVVDEENGQLKIISRHIGDYKDTQGVDEYLLGGVFLETTNEGSFKTQLITKHSGITYMIYSQYVNLNNNLDPIKSIENSKPIYVKDDEVIFDIKHTMFTWNDTFKKYSQMSLYDEIPDGLEYVEAKVYDWNGDEIKGTFKQEGNKVTFEFGTEWLNEPANYSGKEVVMKLKTKVTGDVIGTIKNEAHLVIDGDLDLTTNEVIIKVEEPSVLSGRIWYDQNKNGIQDNSESGISGIKVHLYDENDDEVDTVVTDADGNYIFSGLGKGKYRVEAEIDYSVYEDVTGLKIGGDSAKDSDATADKDNKIAFIAEIDIDGITNVEHMDIGLIKKTPSGGGGNITTTTVTTTTAPNETTPVVTTTDTTVTDVTVTEGTEATTVTAPSDTEATAATSGENSPATGNAPIAMASVPVALTAPAVAISLTRRKKSK